MLVLIIGKYHSKFISGRGGGGGGRGGAKAGSSAEWEGQVYEEVDKVSDPTYMEVGGGGGGGGGNSFQLKHNSAYATTTPSV